MTDSQNTTEENTAFNYTWCMTDHKEGTEIRLGWRNEDYIFHEPYASCIKEMLEKLGLPQPTYKDVFRGTNHDLLFLTSHGVVLRIGPTDPKKLISPGIVQPLGWLESKDIRVKGHPFTIAIYPGVDLARFVRHEPTTGNLSMLFNEMGQSNDDYSTENGGYIRIANENKDTVALNLVIDIDHQYLRLGAETTKKVAESLEKFKTTSDNVADIISHTMQYVYQDLPNIQQYLRAFDTHHPLREMFWEAFKNTDAPDTAALAKFWEACATLTNNPQKAVYPLWRMEKDADGNPTFKREEVRIQDLSLRTPWTYNPSNRVIEPIEPTPQEVEEKAPEEKAPKEKTPFMVKTATKAEEPAKSNAHVGQHFGRILARAAIRKAGL